MKVIFGFVLLVAVGCANTPANNQSLTEKEIDQQTLARYEVATKRADEVSALLTSKFAGQSLFITTPALCTVRSVESMNYSFKDAALQKEELVTGKRPTLEEQRAKAKMRAQCEFDERPFKALSKVLINEVKVEIYPGYMDKSYPEVTEKKAKTDVLFMGVNFSDKSNYQLKWSGAASVYLVASQGSEKFVIRTTFSDLQPLLKSSVKDMLLDGEALTASRFDCLASHNPVVALHLSAKETNAIAKKAPYVGMREEAFLLTAGSPSKVDFMNIKFQPSYVWKYDQPGLEAKHFIFRNSHLKSLK